MFQVINPIFESKGLHLPNDDLFAKTLLYGHDTFNVDENKAVLTATLKFIQDSIRFDVANV